MKQMAKLLVVALLTATFLSGCVIVPAGGWYGDGWYYRPYPYRPYPYGYPYGYPYYRGW
jgi:hypothetical protein